MNESERLARRVARQFKRQLRKANHEQSLVERMDEARKHQEQLDDENAPQKPNQSAERTGSVTKTRRSEKTPNSLESYARNNPDDRGRSRERLNLAGSKQKIDIDTQCLAKQPSERSSSRIRSQYEISMRHGSRNSSVEEERNQTMGTRRLHGDEARKLLEEHVDKNTGKTKVRKVC